MRMVSSWRRKVFGFGRNEQMAAAAAVGFRLVGHATEDAAVLFNRNGKMLYDDYTPFKRNEAITQNERIALMEHCSPANILFKIHGHKLKIVRFRHVPFNFLFKRAAK